MKVENNNQPPKKDPIAYTSAYSVIFKGRDGETYKLIFQGTIKKAMFDFSYYATQERYKPVYSGESITLTF